MGCSAERWGGDQNLRALWYGAERSGGEKKCGRWGAVQGTGVTSESWGRARGCGAGL